MASEKNFENQVKQFLKDEGCWFIKYWGGGEFTKAGIPDILACCGGAFFGIEIKAPKGRPKMLQLHHLKKINESGGYGVLLYPNQFEAFKNLVRCIKEGDDWNAEFNHDIFINLINEWERKLEELDG